jgi:BirA family transcriptional regulator, biotin operon repressor / biotin---[acetyl-CoA-carboxylase] ligase
MNPGTSLPSPYNLIELDTIDSTNEEAKRLAADGAPEGTVVWAHEQTAGRGRRGREWVSAPGNLYCSILLRPECHAFKAMQLSFITSSSMADAVASVMPKGTFVNCKWPNDVLVEGRKVSGILLESQTVPLGGMDWLVIGAGLNITDYPKDVEFPATSLAREGAKDDVTVDMMLKTFCLRFLAGYVTWKNLGFEPGRKAWLHRAAWIGKEISVRLEHETLQGEFKELDKDGALILLHEGSERRITAGDVFV